MRKNLSTDDPEHDEEDFEDEKLDLNQSEGELQDQRNDVGQGWNL